MAAAVPAELRELIIRKVKASGTSFYWAMRLLKADRRFGMYVVYAFCRDVDDIVDEPGDEAGKYLRLALWRDEIAAIYAGTAPSSPLAQSLAAQVDAFGLQQADLLAVIDGCEMDLGPGMVRPSLAKLDLYCDRVAGAVGRLSVRIFGDFTPRSLEVANHQGRALQLTNILRDVVVDASIGRLYLPEELLAAHGVMGTDLPRILAHPALPAVCADLAEIAGGHFGAARSAIAQCSRRAMRPALVMLEMYHTIFRLCARDGWIPREEPVHVPALAKLWCAARFGLI